MSDLGQSVSREIFRLDPYLERRKLSSIGYEERSMDISRDRQGPLCSGGMRRVVPVAQTWDHPRRYDGSKIHSAKPDAALDLIEQASPGPYAELFARRARFGWDYPIGDQALGGEAA